jgi:hypothetical protein
MAKADRLARSLLFRVHRGFRCRNNDAVRDECSGHEHDYQWCYEYYCSYYEYDCSE